MTPSLSLSHTLYCCCHSHSHYLHLQIGQFLYSMCVCERVSAKWQNVCILSAKDGMMNKNTAPVCVSWFVQQIWLCFSIECLITYLNTWLNLILFLLLLCLCLCVCVSYSTFTVPSCIVAFRSAGQCILMTYQKYLHASNQLHTHTHTLTRRKTILDCLYTMADWNCLLTEQVLPHNHDPIMGKSEQNSGLAIA